MKLAYLLMGVALLLSSCSEDIFRAAARAMRMLPFRWPILMFPPETWWSTPEQDMQRSVISTISTSIYLMATGNLKGYKGIEGEVNLNQYTSNTTKRNNWHQSRRSGESYIYAVANISTGPYPQLRPAAVLLLQTSYRST